MKHTHTFSRVCPHCGVENRVRVTMAAGDYDSKTSYDTEVLARCDHFDYVDYGLTNDKIVFTEQP